MRSHSATRAAPRVRAPRELGRSRQRFGNAQAWLVAQARARSPDGSPLSGEGGARLQVRQASSEGTHRHDTPSSVVKHPRGQLILSVFAHSSRHRAFTHPSAEQSHSSAPPGSQICCPGSAQGPPISMPEELSHSLVSAHSPVELELPSGAPAHPTMRAKARANAPHNSRRHFETIELFAVTSGPSWRPRVTGPRAWARLQRPDPVHTPGHRE